MRYVGNKVVVAYDLINRSLFDFKFYNLWNGMISVCWSQLPFWQRPAAAVCPLRRRVAGRTAQLSHE